MTGEKLTNLFNFHVNFNVAMEHYIQNQGYQVGDIVKVRYGRVGQIVHFIHDRCTIKLLNGEAIVTEYFFNKYKPESYSISEYCTIIEGSEEKIIKASLKFMCIKIKHIEFYVNRPTIDRFLNSKDEGEKFKLMLRGLWNNLVIRQVKTVNLPSEILSAQELKIDDKGYLQKKDLFSLCRKIVLPEDDANTVYISNYSKYYGFTKKKSAKDNEIYFSRKNYNSFDFEFEKSSYFGNCGNFIGGYTPPYVGQYVCGTVSCGNQGLYYDKWFICSSQFINFYRFIMSDEPVDYDNILKSVKLKNTFHSDHYGKFSPEMASSVLKRIKFSINTCDYSGKYPYKMMIDHIRYSNQSGEIISNIY